MTRPTGGTYEHGTCGLRNGREWHIASFAACPRFGRYRMHCGHWPKLALNGSVAIDPERTFGVEGADQQDGPQRRTRHRADDVIDAREPSYLLIQGQPQAGDGFRGS